MRRFNFRVFCWVFFGALALTTVCERLMPRVYVSAGAIQLIRSDPQVLISVRSEIAESRPRLNEILPVIEDIDLKNIVRRMPAEDRSALLRPYGYDSNKSGDVVEKVLRGNFRITPKHLNLIVIISYRHPSPEVALKMADLFMEECLARHFRLREQEIARTVEELGIRFTQQALTVQKLERELEDAKTHRSIGIEAYERKLTVNRALLGNLRARKEMMSEESLKPLLRVVDHPVLARPDDYVRSPLMKILRWRWGIAAVMGLMVAGWVRRGQATRSRSRLQGT